jgi:hypothetical protein
MALTNKVFNTPEMQELLLSILVKSDKDSAALDKEYNRITKEYKYKCKYGVDINRPGKRLRPTLGHSYKKPE